MKTITFLAVLCGASAGMAGEMREGFFYAVGNEDAGRRLYTIDFAGNVTAIGPEGGLGFLDVKCLVWDNAEERLFGYDDALDVWLEINPLTGQATEIASVGFFVGICYITYNPIDDRVYFNGGHLTAVNKNTGELESTQISLPTVGLTFSTSGLAGRAGFYTHQNGLLFVTFPEFERFAIGGNVTNRHGMYWDSLSEKLYSIDLLTSNAGVYEVNRITGNETLIVEWSLPFNVVNLAFVPQGDPPMRCNLMDVDNDSDIDLEDYAAFQNCLTGPM